MAQNGHPGKFLALVLRHQPQRIGLTLDGRGWARVSDLIQGMRAAGYPLDRGALEVLVAEDDKQRFSFSPDGQQIRANQGHSLPLDLQLQPAQPPETLFHGTARRFLPSIREQGLLPRGRHHVHLSANRETAVGVGARHGSPVVLNIDAGEMWRAGRCFYLSENGVWLTDRVEPRWLHEA